MNLVDRNGRAIPVVKERKALGFIERTVKADDGDVVNGSRRGRRRTPNPDGKATRRSSSRTG